MWCKRASHTEVNLTRCRHGPVATLSSQNENHGSDGAFRNPIVTDRKHGLNKCCICAGHRTRRDRFHIQDPRMYTCYTPRFTDSGQAWNCGSSRRYKRVRCVVFRPRSIGAFRLWSQLIFWCASLPTGHKLVKVTGVKNLGQTVTVLCRASNELVRLSHPRATPV